MFLSGGQSDELATAHLDAMNRLEPQPWQLSFSYGRALQAPALKAWKGETANVPAAKMAFYHRAKLNGAARFGRYSEEMETPAMGKRASMTRIGVLTGGGDVPGSNPCIKTLVYGAVERGYEVVGLCTAGPACSTMTSMPTSHRPIASNRSPRPTCARSTAPAEQSCTPAAPTREGQAQGRAGVPRGPRPGRIRRSFRLHRPLSGGDRAPRPGLAGPDRRRRHPPYGQRLASEGVPVVAVPKTMDNDVFGTDYCIGFSTAVTRSVQFIHQLRTSAGSHERIAVIELFGRNCGETSLLAAYLAGVDRALISEVPFDPELLASYVLEDKAANPSNYAMVTVSEGARMLEGSIEEFGEQDAYGHRKLGGIGLATGNVLKQLTGEDIIYQQVAYLMRSGAPDALDLMVGATTPTWRCT